MDAPVEKGEETKPFLTVCSYLAEVGFSSPTIYFSDQGRGFILMEDLGDDLFARVCEQSPDQEAKLYAAAIDVLVKLKKAKLPKLPEYSTGVYLREANLALQWYRASVISDIKNDDLINKYNSILGDLFEKLECERSCCVHRDYHAENLIWLPTRDAAKRAGLLDFQDALIGHPAYDLVSLLEDARRDTSRKLRTEMIGYYLERTGLDRQNFLRAYSILGAQRNLKIIGIFSRLCVRDGKAGYVSMIPRVWDHLQRDLSHPDLKELKEFVMQHLPVPTPEVLKKLEGAAA